MPPPEHAPGTRQAIYEFSDRSRSHLDHICCNSGHLIKSQFCLTYHHQQPTDGTTVKRDLDRWLKSYRRRNPGSPYLWVLEFQNRGAPHYHVFLGSKVNRDMQKKMAKSWVRITKGDHKQEWWHNRPDNWMPWQMETASYVLKNYVVKTAQKEVPPSFQNVGRFWGCSRNMHPVPTVITPEQIANLTQKAVIPWEPEAIRRYFDRTLRRWQEHQMNYDRQGNRRKNHATGKPRKWKSASMIRQNSELSGEFKIKNGSKIIEKLLNYVVQHGPDPYSLAAAIKERIPF